MKKALIAILILTAATALLPAVYESAGHQTALYRNDIIILKKILAERPKDRIALERMVKLSFTMELFEDSVLYAERFLSLYRSVEISYLKTLSLADLSRYREASAEIDRILAFGELTWDERMLLTQKRAVLSASFSANGEPVSSSPVSWGKECVAVGISDRTYSLIAFDTVRKKLFRYSFKDGTVSDFLEPQFTDGLDASAVLNMTVSNDGRELFVTIADPSGGVYILHRYYDIEDEKWSSWSRPGFARQGTINGYANLLSDGEHLVFVSNRDASNGIDIYAVSRTDTQSWNEPAKVTGANTPLDECSLYIHPDGETLYFWSNGHPGSGGYDLFTGKLSSFKGVFKIGSVTNLAQANTFRNESFPLYSAFNTDNAFFTFIRNGSPQIYKTLIPQTRPAAVSFLEIRVFDAETKQPLRSDAKMIRLNDRTSGITLFNSTDKRGNANFAVRRGARYTISIEAEGYIYRSESVDIGTSEDFITRSYYIKKGKIEKGYTLIVENIYFDAALSDIRDESEQGLQELLSFMKKNPLVTIEIAGHTDNTGSQEYNLKLSRSRSKSISVYLIKRGIRSTRITTKGFGFSQNLKPNDTEEGRQMNRRVEITVVGTE